MKSIYIHIKQTESEKLKKFSWFKREAIFAPNSLDSSYHYLIPLWRYNEIVPEEKRLKILLESLYHYML